VKNPAQRHRSHKRAKGKKTANHQNNYRTKAMRKCQTSETNMEQQRGNHEINWKTPITEEDTDGNVNDDDGDGDDDDDDNNNIKSTIARQGPANR